MKITPKTIFIWVGYGDVSVYHIDTQEKYDTLFKEVETVCEQLEGSDEKFDGIKSIMGLINAMGGVGCHESFEYGTGWSTLK